MRIDYRLLRKTVYGFSKQLMIIAGLLVLPITAGLERIANAQSLPTRPPVTPESVTPQACKRADSRVVRLASFLNRLHCPVAGLAGDFVKAADDNQLDWRLLPSISVIESGGGKAARNNNIFGWDNGNQFFPTLRDGIEHVAFRLGRSPLYRNRDVVGKLRLYNPDQKYVYSVLNVMRQISPAT